MGTSAKLRGQLAGPALAGDLALAIDDIADHAAERLGGLLKFYYRKAG